MSNLPVVAVSSEDKKNAIQASIYYMVKANPFVGTLLQELTIRYTSQVPTAGITYNKKTKLFDVFINENFFCNKLDLPQKIGVLTHEMLHFLHQHLFRLPFLLKDIKPEERMLFNIAGDMAINQLINNLPSGCSQ